MRGRNGGTLRVGNPGNKGGGRRPDELRALARESLAVALERVSERLRAPDLQDAELVKLAELLLKYGIGPAQAEGPMERPSPRIDFGF
jgi:hypothetical protein